MPLDAPLLLERTRMVPACLSMICLLTQRPSLVPTVPFVVKNGSKICCRKLPSMLLPLSATVTRTRRSPFLKAAPVDTRASSALASGDFAGFHRQAQAVLHEYPGAAFALADATGQQLVNTWVPFGTPLPSALIYRRQRRLSSAHCNPVRPSHVDTAGLDLQTSR